MTPQEQTMLNGLIDRVRNTPLPNKDADADRHIQETLGRDPNALYILCQSVLVQGYALEQAQKKLAALPATPPTAAPAQHEPTFLEKIFGTREPEPQPPTPLQGGTGYGAPVYSGQPVQSGYGNPAPFPPQGYPQAYSQPGYPPQGYAPAQGGFGSGGLGGGGFLQGALQTAAGVAMGELAFQSIEGLFRGFGHAAGYGSDRAMGFADSTGSGNSDYAGGDGFFSREQAENGVNEQLSPDIEDRRGDTGRGFLGGDDSDRDTLASDEAATDSGYDVDNSVTEDNGSDFTDSGSFDDGGGFDDGNS